MKAALVTRYGPPDVVQIGEAPKPAPGAGELLIRVHAASVNRTDCGELRAHPFPSRLVFGLTRPNRTIFGMDVAGEVEAVGAGVTAFKVGDRVFGMCPFRKNGAHAEYVAVADTAPIALMPANLAYEQAVVCEGAYYANPGLKRFRLGPGQRILIYGASGAIGTAAVQLAKFHGAEVTAVVAARHLELAKSLGADRVIDYTLQDFTRIGERFDFVFDAVGKASFFRCRRLLKPGAVYLSTDVGPWGQNLPLAFWSWISGSNRVVVALPERAGAQAFVAFLGDLMAAGRFRAVIDRTYPLDAIADAYRYVETGQKTGIVAIKVASD
jgi:NADPH:quinone reductase-like Zn-dependent oxidoreductase